MNSACIALNFLGGVSLLVSANEARKIITVAAAYFETVDKTKAGHGDEAPIADLTDALNTRQKTENTVLTRQKTENMVLASSGTPVDYNNDSNNIDDDGIKTLKTDIITTNKTAMESAGIAALFGNGKVKADDPNVRSFNFSSNIKTLLGGLGTSMAAFKTCSLAKIAVNSISAFKSVVEAAGCIAGLLGSVATFGASGVAGCGPLVANVIKGVAVGVGISMVLSGIIATITPIVASALTRDIISDLGGESLGNALTFGANMYMGGTHRANGGSLMTKEKYVEFAAKQQGVIADNARFERLRLSPFDLSSKYTFMGSIMRQLMAFSTASSLMGIVSSGSSVVSSSLLALNNSTASAVDISKNLYTDEEYDEICSNLADIGAVGDADCNPYSGTDISTMELDPVDVVDKLEEEGNFEEQSDDDGIVDKVVNKTIKAGSKLAKYILLCGDRWSYGVADQNIINEVTNGFRVSSGNSAIDTVSNSAIGAIPVIGDVVDILSDNVALRNIGYISGSSCVAGNKVNAADSPNWEEAKYYQRFIEDQTLAESMGYIVTAFLKKYFSENPIDNSYEGMLARYSGLDKETVTDILDVLAYYDYVANYHPEERYAFGTPAVQTKEELRFDNENRLGNVDSILLNEISFADVRNRSFAV